MNIVSTLFRRQSAGLLVAILAILAVSPALPDEARDGASYETWRQMTQEELDASLRHHKSCNRDAVIERWGINSELARERIGTPQRYAYGAGDNEQLDVFKTGANEAPIMVFVHGGGWRSTRARDYAFLAEAFINNGVHYVALDFDSVTDVDGNIGVLVEQVRTALAWIYRNADLFGGDRNQIYISGHSSGGHLAGVMVTSDWETSYGIPERVVRGAVLISGLYDLEPVMQSYRSEYLAVDDQAVAAFSPLYHTNKISVPILFVYGTLDGDAHQQQGEELARRGKAAGKDVALVELENYNHFEVLETMGNPKSLVGYKTLALIDEAEGQN